MAKTRSFQRDAPLIFEIKGSSFDDGPGIRSVVFFKGCPLSCLWCHNPEGKSPHPEMAFDAQACVDCGHCRSVCPQGALNHGQEDFIDREKCDLCFQCVEQCPSGALRRVGSAWCVDDIVKRVMRDKPFFDASGGGVTLSGGEPTLFMDFTAELSTRLKEHDLHILLETCGMFDLDTFRRKLHPLVDCIYFDLKIIDSCAHLRFCGSDNQVILNNFREICRWSETGAGKIVPRLPLIPGITDTPENLLSVVDLLKACGSNEIRLLPYHPLWLEKAERLGHGIAWNFPSDPGRVSPAEKMKAARALFSSAGIRT